MPGNKRAKVESRQEAFVEKAKTSIAYEVPHAENPFLADQHYWHGYDSLELAKQRDFTDVLLLMLRGELPSPADKALLNTLMVALANPGPRHPAVRAGMNASIGKTRPEHFLPIACSVLGGQEGGAGEISFAMRFIQANLKQPLSDILTKEQCPGFGSRYGQPDPYLQKILTAIKPLTAAGDAINWCVDVNNALLEKGEGILASGLCAAVFSDLGIGMYQAVPLYQLICSPGIIAHAAEYAREPRTSLPFVTDANYDIE